MSWAWPVTLTTVLPGGSTLVLRPLARSDREAWQEVRARNARWLAPWESTVPGRPAGRTPFTRLRRSLERAARDGFLLPFVVEADGRLVGQVQLFDVLGGARSSGLVGYWLDEEATGHGYATWAVALLIDHALGTAGLHRVEVAIRPENTASLRVAERLRLPEEGLRRGFRYVDGRWADHRCFAVLAEDLRPGGYAEGGLVDLLRRDPGGRPPGRPGRTGAEDTARHTRNLRDTPSA